MKYREATLADIPALRTLEQGVIDAERPFNDNIQPQDVTYYDLNALITNNNSQLLVLEHEGELVGAGYVQIREAKPYFVHSRLGYLGFMFVAPSMRGQGINKHIMQQLMGWAKNKGIKDFYLDVYAENEAAIKAYEKLGFKPNLVEMRVTLD